MADVKVEEFIPGAAKVLGEGPHWEERTGKLLYVDILANTVHRYHVESGTAEQIKLEGEATLIVPATDTDTYIVSSKRKLCHLNWVTSQVTDIVEVPIIGDDGDRFNDGKCDAHGRLWAGTMNGKPDKAKLFCLEKDKLRTVVSPLSISNGLAWSADNTIMYHIDSTPRHVYAYDYDITTGTISNKRIAVDFNQWSKEDAGDPDGMTIDQDGNLWVAGFGSAKIMKFDPNTGKRLQDVNIPAIQTTSCCFGGKDYSELFVTTGAVGLSEHDKKKYPKSGSLFRVTGLGVKGRPANNYNSQN